MKIEAAIVRAPKAPFVVEMLTLASPQSDELLVKITAVGICHTDLAVRDGDIPIPGAPCVLGHEGAGVVVKCGSQTEGFSVGDHVVLSFASCGQCPMCLANQPARCDDFIVRNLSGCRPDGSGTHLKGDEPINANFFGQSAFGTYTVVKSRYAVPVPKDIPLELLAPLGCGIQTGAGTVLNALRPVQGESLAVFGAGAVGLSSIMAARIAGCGPIIAIDFNDGRLELAREMGATDCVNPRQEDCVEAIARICGGGAQYIVEASGSSQAISDAIVSVKRFGAVALVGAPKFGSTVTVDANAMLSGAHIFGVVEGDSDPKDFIPKLIELYRSGKLPIDRLIEIYDFSDLNKAASDSENGTVIKPVLRMPISHTDQETA